VLNQLDERIRYSKANKRILRKLRPFRGGIWDENSKDIKLIKAKIRTTLKCYQDNKCAYCSQPLDVTSGSEIEHIAPKGGPVYPKHTEFTFTPFNLVLSCHLCNSPVKKGRRDTIVSKDINYKNCVFNIVHPYFDNPTDHFEVSHNSDFTGVIFKPLTEKARISNSVFKLNDEAHVTARGRIEVAKQLEKENINEYRRLLFKSILEYK